MNTESPFDIDKNRLDEEWLRQPRLYMKYSEEVATYRKTLEDTKIKLEVYDAETELDIRKNPEKYNVPKLTEGCIQQVLALQEEHVRYRRLIAKRKYDLDIAQAAVSTLDNKKKALEDLVQLQLSNYWSEPRAPKGVSKETIDDMKEKARNRKRE